MKLKHKNCPNVESLTKLRRELLEITFIILHSITNTKYNETPRLTLC